MNTFGLSRFGFIIIKHLMKNNIPITGIRKINGRWHVSVIDENDNIYWESLSEILNNIEKFARRKCYDLSINS